MEYFSKEELQIMNRTTLQELADNRNASRKGEVISFNTKTRKDDLIEMLLSDQAIESAEVWESYALPESQVITVTLDQIKVCPLNPRHDVDYKDPDLFASIKRANGLTRLLTVVRSELVNPKVKDQYYVIAGNRSFTNLCDVVTAPCFMEDDPELEKTSGWDMSLEEYEVQVQLRDFQGTDKQILAQILSELENDNDSAKQFTVIDKLNLINLRLEQGMTKTAIAKDRGVSPSYITQVTSLNILPEEYLDLVHFKSREDILQNYSVPELDKCGVRYRLTPDGDPIIEGVPYNTALDIADTYPRKPRKTGMRKSEYQAAYQEWEDLCARISVLYLQEEVIKAACTKDLAEFKPWIRTYLANSGLIPSEEPTSAPTQHVETVTQTDIEDYIEPDDEPYNPEPIDPEEGFALEEAVEITDEDVEELTKGEGVPTLKACKETLQLFRKDRGSFLKELKCGNLDMVMDWQDAVTVELALGDEVMESQIENLISLGLLKLQ